MKKLQKLKNKHRIVMASNNLQELKTFRKELSERLGKLRKKYKRWHFLEEDYGLLGICGAVAFFSSALSWLPGVVGSIMIGTTILSVTTFVNVFISRLFVSKCVKIHMEEERVLTLIKEIDEKTKELETGFSIKFSYLDKPEIVKSKYLSEEYIARKSDDFDLR